MADDIGTSPAPRGVLYTSPGLTKWQTGKATPDPESLSQARRYVQIADAHGIRRPGHLAAKPQLLYVMRELSLTEAHTIWQVSRHFFQLRAALV